MARLAIQADRIGLAPADRADFSGRWLQLAAERGIETLVVDVRAPGFIDQVADCDAFLWRFGARRENVDLAKKLLPALEQGLNVPVFPAYGQTWWAEDKLAQHFLLRAARLPYPDSWLFWDASAARRFCDTATYPLVLKLASGFGSANVALLHNRAEAEYWIGELFGQGVRRLEQAVPSWLARRRRQASTVMRMLRRRDDFREQGYFFVQEFLPDNAFDTRVTVIGRRVFAFRRRNRPDDFRASGSGNIDWDPRAVAPEAVRLGFTVAQRLKTQVVAVDVMRRGSDYIATELNFSFRAGAIDACPGHWSFDDGGTQGPWHDGPVRAADAIFDDVLTQLDLRAAARTRAD